ncbi:hypothetical protein H4I95_01220 [Botrytis cinerea]
MEAGHFLYIVCDVPQYVRHVSLASDFTSAMLSPLIRINPGLLGTHSLSLSPSDLVHSFRKGSSMSRRKITRCVCLVSEHILAECHAVRRINNRRLLGDKLASVLLL